MKHCKNCGKAVNPEIGNGIITVFSHTPFCDKHCYNEYERKKEAEELLKGTETGGDYDVKDNL